MRQSFTKFFKKRKAAEEEQAPEQYQTVESNQLAHSSPEELMQVIYRYDAEVKRLNQVLDESRSVGAELVKAREEAQLYKEHMEALQKHAQEVNLELGDVKTLLDSKQSEVTLLRGQLSAKEQLLAQLREPGTETSSAEVQAAQQSVKLLEKELAQKEAHATSLINDKKHLADKVQQLERELQGAELTLRKERLETEAVRGELARVNFLKQSLENEIKALRESLSRTDEKLRLKEDKLEKLQDSLLEKQTEIAGLRQDAESKRLEYSRAAAQAEDENRREKEQLQAKITKISEEHQKTTEQNSSLIQRLSTALKETEEKVAGLLTKKAGFEVEIELLRQTCDAAVNRANTLEVDNQRLEENMRKVQHKREMAKAEVLRLSQKLETRSSPGAQQQQQQWMKITPESVKEDKSALSAIKHELELLYKQLMQLMMNARTSTGPKLDYLISADDFSQFERRLNNLFVQVHEALEASEATVAQPETVYESWGTKLSGAVSSIRQTVSGRGPVKLFSCMTGDTTSQHRPRTAQGRSLKSNTGEARRGKPSRDLSRHS